MEAGQLRLSPVAPIGLGRHTQADQEEERIDTSDDDASRISNAAADAETEYDSVSCVRVQPVVGPSPPPLSRVESASLPQLLQVATTSHQVDTSTTSLVRTTNHREARGGGRCASLALTSRAVST